VNSVCSVSSLIHLLPMLPSLNEGLSTDGGGNWKLNPPVRYVPMDNRLIHGLKNEVLLLP